MKAVLITGANRGIGLEHVRRFVERGVQVFAATRSLQWWLDASALSGLLTPRPAAGAMGKDIFRVEETDGVGLARARPTNGSDRGFARSNLTR